MLSAVGPFLHSWRPFSRCGLFLEGGHKLQPYPPTVMMESSPCRSGDQSAGRPTAPEENTTGANLHPSRLGPDKPPLMRRDSKCLWRIYVRDAMRRRFTQAGCRKARPFKQRYRLSDIAERSLAWPPLGFDPGLLPMALTLSAFALPAS